MPTAAIQLPFRTTPARSLGAKLFRKQVLPVGSLEYEGRKLTFDRPYLRRLVENFKGKAFDQVAFVLADKDNLHTQDPERYRGEVKGFELTDDGLDAIVELTDDGAKIIRENPRLGVSPRIVEEQVPGMNGPKAPAIHHVCGTLTGRLNGLRDWEAISDLSPSYSPDQVIDLTAATYEKMPGTDADTKLTDEQRTKLLGLVGDDAELKAGVETLLGKGDGETTDGDPAAPAPKPDGKQESEPKKPGALARLLAKATGRDPSEFDEGKIAEGIDGVPSSESKPGEPEPVALSADAERAVELSAKDSAEARRKADRLERELNEERFERRKTELIDAGVPPHMVDLAAPVLKGEDDKVIELSGGEKTSAREVMNKLLDEAKGTIDLSDPSGSALADDDPEVTEARKIAADDKAWDA